MGQELGHFDHACHILGGHERDWQQAHEGGGCLIQRSKRRDGVDDQGYFRGHEA